MPNDTKRYPESNKRHTQRVHVPLYRVLWPQSAFYVGYFGAEVSDIWVLRPFGIPKTISTPQLPFKIPQIPSNRDYKALNRGTLGGLGIHVPLLKLFLQALVFSSSEHGRSFVSKSREAGAHGETRRRAVPGLF